MLVFYSLLLRVSLSNLYFCEHVPIPFKMSIPNNFASLNAILPPAVKLVAVSKNHPAGSITEAYNCGQRRFGENKVQELISKQKLLPSDIEWHFIGHLQTNKIRPIISFVKMIHSIDSIRLLSQVNKEAARIGRTVDCLLEMYIATEESKFGLDLAEARSLFESDEYKAMKNIRLCGVMGMATFTEDTVKVRSEFRSLKGYFEILKKDYFEGDPGFSEISMGMSDDFRIAVEEGSTMIRVGTTLFGSRNALQDA